MLRVTPEAGLAIRTLVEQQGGAADGGLRIEALSAEHSRPRFAISVAAMQDELDQVVSETTTGARVLLDSLTAEHVTNSVLHVDATLEGTPQFRLKPAK